MMTTIMRFIKANGLEAVIALAPSLLYSTDFGTVQFPLDGSDFAMRAVYARSVSRCPGCGRGRLNLPQVECRRGLSQPYVMREVDGQVQGEVS